MKKMIALALCVLMICMLFAGCGKETVSSGKTEVVSSSSSDAASSVPANDSTGSADSSSDSSSSSSKLVTEQKSTDPLLDIDSLPAADLDAADADYQKKAPQAGEEIAVIHTNYGDISIKFFPEVAPKAVYNFIALAKAGRYDDTIFHRVINNFMIQGGDYTNYNGTGGVSAYGKEFELEVSDYLSNIEGAVAMANRGPGTNGSQFYINQVNNTYLDGNYTVFGQVIDGMDVVNEIAGVQTGANDKPAADVIISSVEIKKYA